MSLELMGDKGKNARILGHWKLEKKIQNTGLSKNQLMICTETNR